MARLFAIPAVLPATLLAACAHEPTTAVARAGMPDASTSVATLADTRPSSDGSAAGTSGARVLRLVATLPDGLRLSADQQGSIRALVVASERTGQADRSCGHGAVRARSTRDCGAASP